MNKMGESSSLLEFIDLDELQAIQDSFAKTVGISSVIFSPEGEPLTRFSYPTGFCSLIQSTEEGKRRCFQSVKEMSRKAIKLKKPAILYCFAHGGHFVAPIIINDEHKGTMFAGQFIPQSFSPKQLKALEKTAVEINLDPQLLTKEAKEMCVIEEDVVEYYSSLLFQIVKFIGRLGAKAAELNRAQDALQKARDELETRVQERTAELVKSNKQLKREIAERKRAEEALLQSEIKYRTLVEHIPAITYIAALDESSTTLYVSPQIETILGISPADYKADPDFWVKHLHPDDRERVMDEIRRCHESDQPFISEYRMVSKDGRLVWLSDDAVIVKDDKGKPLHLHGVMYDITERKRMEELLRSAEADWRDSFNSLEEVMLIIDRDYNIENINEVGLALLGKSKEEVLGEKCYQVIHGAENPGEFCPFKETLKTKKVEATDRYEERFGKYFSIKSSPIFDENGEIVKSIDLMRDITERKQAEEALKQKVEQQEVLLSSIPAFVYYKGIESNLIAANRAFAEMVNVPIDQLVGKDAYDLFPKEQAKKFHIDDKKVMSSGRPIMNIEEKFTDAEGKTRWASTSKVPSFDEKGKVTGMVGITFDITERKRAEKERERLLKELEAKTAEMNRFTYTVSHDLRSPIVTIQGFAEMLRKDLEHNEIEKVKSDLKYIESSATKMDRLLTDTLQLSRIGRFVNPPEDVPFGEIVQEAQVQTTVQIKSSGVVISEAEDFPIVHVDRMRIVEVLVNLITNSINYMGEQPHPKIDIGYRADDSETVFFVQDNGVGIDKSQHEKVFELFYTVDKSSNGTGAGLAIVKRIIEVHRSRIWIESEKGKGCTVCFTLPVA